MKPETSAKLAHLRSRVFWREVRALFVRFTADLWLLCGSLLIVFSVYLVKATVDREFGSWLTSGVMLVLLVATVITCLDSADRQLSVERLTEQLTEELQRRPSGAPRIMEVPCRHGDLHRYQYVDGRWEPVGPAVRES